MGHSREHTRAVSTRAARVAAVARWRRNVVNGRRDTYALASVAARIPLLDRELACDRKYCGEAQDCGVHRPNTSKW